MRLAQAGCWGMGVKEASMLIRNLPDDKRELKEAAQ
jgi:hypothetical protein